MVSNNINPKYNIPMQALGQSQPGGVPMQAIDAKAVRQSVDNSRVGSRMNASDDSPYKLPVMAGLWYGLNKGADKFNASCAGEFDKTILGKAGAWGDKVSGRVKSTGVGKLLVKAKNGINSGINWLTGKNKVAYALKHTPTSPEWEFAKMPAQGLNGFLTMDIKSLFDDFLKPIADPIALEQYGVSKNEIKALSDSIKGLPKEARLLELHKAELKALGLKPHVIDQMAANRGVEGMAQVAQKLKIRKLGFRNTKSFTAWKADAFANKNILMDALNRADDKISISAWRGKYKRLGSSKFGNFWNNAFGRKVTLSELRNKARVTMTNTTAKSSLGRGIQKAMGWLVEGTTGRFGGGKLIPLMMSVAIADSIISTFKAPKGEKVKTFADRTVNDFSYVFALPVGVMAMHKLGGMKFAGLDKAGVAAYNKALASHNAKAAAGAFASKADWKASSKALDKMLKADTKWYTRIFKKIGSFINIGNQTKTAYKSVSKWNLNFLRKVPNFLRNCVGAPLRVWIAMGLIGGLVSKVCTKGAHAVFGRPTKSVLDEEVEPEVVDQQIAQQTSNNPFQQPINHESPTNLINMYQNGEQYQDTTSTNNDNYTYVPSPTGVQVDGKTLEPARTYVPSPVAAQIQGEDMTAGNAALQRAEAAERMAMETLAMKW